MTGMRFVELGSEVDYLDAWEQQRQVHARVVAGEDPGTVLLLEHRAVYTAGKRTLPEERPDDGTPVVDVDRGGKITWHGPGQLVGYPILPLPSPIDVVRYVRELETAMIAVCASLGLAAGRVEGRSGVWFPADPPGPLPGRPERKVGAIGIRVAQRVTMHGFALNCDNTLESFGHIVPCGIPDAGVTTLSAELGRHVGVAEVMPLMRGALDDALSIGSVATIPQSA